MKACGIGSRAAVVAAIISILGLTFAGADLRDWTSTAGSTLKAEYVRMIGDKVLLKKEDGDQMTVKLDQLSEEDQKFIEELTAEASGPSAADQEKLSALIPKALEGKLVKFDGKKLVDFSLAESPDGAPDFYAFYYSASWCPPCRGFTPDLVKFYNTQKRKHPNFEIVFVSSDNSEDDMEEYMDDYKMEYPALEYKAKGRTKEATKYAGGGIPCLVVVNAAGEVLSDSYVDVEGSDKRQYRGPNAVLKEFEKILKDNAPTDA
ncbi:MAG: thioredoxin-like domain-containing protein [Verrucomicrobiota bacterium]